MARIWGGSVTPEELEQLLAEDSRSQGNLVVLIFFGLLVFAFVIAAVGLVWWSW